jgi:hypothetical protein
VIPRSSRATVHRTDTPTATFAAPSAAATGSSPGAIDTESTTNTVHPTAPAGIAHHRPITKPTNHIVGITHQVSHPGKQISGIRTRPGVA